MLNRSGWSRFFILIFLTLPLVLTGCPGGGGGGGSGAGDAGGGAAPQTTGTVQGVVLDAASGLAVAGATVTVLDGATVLGVTFTDANGNYSIEVPAGSGYTVRVTSAGYDTRDQNGVGVTVNAATPLDLDIDAQPGPAATGTIQGVVRNFDTNAGIVGATISVYDGATLLDTTTTDANGNFSLLVAAGLDYVVEVSAPGFITASYNGVDVLQDETTILESVLAIADTYSGNGTVAGTVTNSLTGTGLAGVTVNLRAGLNSQTGAVVTTGTTNGAGEYSIAGVPTGYYTAELSAAGYITAFISVYSRGGQTTGNQNASISPVLAAGETRVVLTWGAAPADLDTHFTGPTTSGPRFHIAYYDQNINDGTVASLDADDTSSYGPETITLTTQISGTYRYYVHDFTNGGANPSTALSNSGAQVKVYNSTGLAATFNVPANQGGTIWEVFELSGGTITPINLFSYDNSTTLP
jgi:hypothetical protein